jgi:hypothetical protein
MKTINLINKRFGKLVVKKQSEERGNKGQIKWECVCDCGNKHITSGESLRGGKSKSCGCNRLTPPNKEKDRELAVWKQLYKSTIEKRSKKMGYKSDISFETFKKISLEKCYYCGLEPSNFATDRNSKGKKTSNTIIKYNGIDRIDSTRGYLTGNVVACCKYCNTAKNTMTQKEFKQFIKRVYEYNF